MVRGMLPLNWHLPTLKIPFLKAVVRSILKREYGLIDNFTDKLLILSIKNKDVRHRIIACHGTGKLRGRKRCVYGLLEGILICRSRNVKIERVPKNVRERG